MPNKNLIGVFDRTVVGTSSGTKNRVIIDKLVKEGISTNDLIKVIGVLDPTIKLPGTPPIIPTPPEPTPPAPEETQPSFEIDTKLQILISSIPIANPGNIITSEYHNALRDAVRALASKIGLSINPTAEFQILTFSPNFLPITAGVNTNWNVTLNRATTPQVAASAVVSGGFVVQLPDGATIFQMIVRGKRLGTSAPNPSQFKIALNRLKFGQESEPITLISMDLKTVKDGAFKEEEGVKLSQKELDSTTIERIANDTISDKKFVNNEAWMYFVTAEWTAGVDTAAKFEINSIQILCTV